jgi:hypothetical protein
LDLPLEVCPFGRRGTDKQWGGTPTSGTSDLPEDQSLYPIRNRPTVCGIDLLGDGNLLIAQGQTAWVPQGLHWIVPAKNARTGPDPEISPFKVLLYNSVCPWNGTKILNLLSLFVFYYFFIFILIVKILFLYLFKYINTLINRKIKTCYASSVSWKKITVSIMISIYIF